MAMVQLASHGGGICHGVHGHPKRAYASLPLVLNLDEYDDIIGSDSLFCRKMDPVESCGLMDMLDKHNGLRQKGDH